MIEAMLSTGWWLGRSAAAIATLPCLSRLFGLKQPFRRHCSRLRRFQTSRFCRNTASHLLPGRSRLRTRELPLAVDAIGNRLGGRPVGRAAVRRWEMATARGAQTRWPRVCGCVGGRHRMGRRMGRAVSHRRRETGSCGAGRRAAGSGANVRTAGFLPVDPTESGSGAATVGNRCRATSRAA